jgi:hypothetical protein
MDGIEINEKYVRAFKAGKLPNGKPRWAVGQWALGDSEIEHTYPKSFESKEDAQAFIAELNIRES